MLLIIVNGDKHWLTVNKTMISIKAILCSNWQFVSFWVQPHRSKYKPRVCNSFSDASCSDRNKLQDTGPHHNDFEASILR